MFKSLLAQFNKDFPYKAGEDLVLAKSCAKSIIDNNWNDFFEQLENRYIDRKIMFIDKHIKPKIEQITKYTIESNRIVLELSNGKKKAIKVKKIEDLISTYFLIDEKDELFNLLIFYFLEEKNFVKIQIFDQLG